jgi:1,4-alpha-glucan branching enzyme
MFQLLHELTNRRKNERSVSYVECHDQAIVGGQTAIFRLAGAAMYDSMHTGSQNMEIDRAVALHKMARLATAAAAGNGYLNFMGNEFGHPEWIDFPREGNNWSCDHARRQWSLADDPGLRFQFLNRFDREMMQILSTPGFYEANVQHLKVDDNAKIIAFERNDYYFIFNFHPCNSVSDYPLEVRPYVFETVLDSDAAEFGGHALRTPGQRYFALQQTSGTFLKLYLPSRTALVLKRTAD